MFKRESDSRLSDFTDDEVIGEAVLRLVNLFKKKGGDKYELGVSFVIDPEWGGNYSVELQRKQNFFRGQPPLKLVKPIL